MPTSVLGELDVYYGFVTVDCVSVTAIVISEDQFPGFSNEAARKQ